MRKIVVLLDSHSNTYGINKLIPILEEADNIISLGDTVNDHNTLESLFSDKLIAVKGNCDNNALADEIIIEIEGLKFFITHGHKYRVKSSSLDILLRAEELQANVVLYGHTHRANIEEINNIRLINPGAMWANSQMSYCYIVINKGKIYPTIVPLT